MYNQFQFPYPMTPSQLIRVNGLESAKAYQAAPNSTVALFDSNDDVMYIKSTDASNFPTIRKFRFVEETDNTAFITREEFEAFKKEVANVKQSISKPNGSSNQNSKSNKQ